MNASFLLSPPVGTVLIVGLSAWLIASHAGWLAVAARDAGLSRRARFGVPLLAAALLASWLGWAESSTLARAAAAGAVPRDLRGALPDLLSVAALTAAGVTFICASKTMRGLIAVTPSWWLIAMQTYRVAGLIFIWPYMTAGVVPPGFALPAGIGDVVTGLSAPLIAAAVANGWRGASRWAVIWNWFGIVDLVVAPLAAVVTRTDVFSIYPLGLIPLFLGPPMGILTHVCSLRNLAVTGGRSIAEPVAGIRAATA